MAREQMKLSTEPVLPAQVEVLRKAWVEAIDKARSGTDKARRDAESRSPDDALRHDLMVYIDAMRFDVELRRSAYEDAFRRFEIQEGRQHDAASDRLAITNTRLVYAIVLAAAIQAAAAIAQAYYAAKGVQ